MLKVGLDPHNPSPPWLRLCFSSNFTTSERENNEVYIQGVRKKHFKNFSTIKTSFKNVSSTTHK